MNNTNSQAGQDQFVLSVLKRKMNGFFLEIGSNDPIKINNSYILENTFNWTGLMVEYDRKYENLYKTARTSKYIIQDATQVDYLSLFKQYNFPKSMDYLQVDLEVDNESTIKTLDLLDSTIFPEYTFSTVTFEHDIYRGNFFNTRQRSRDIFKKNGYVLVFPDVKNSNSSFEDWYVYPETVDMDYVNKLITDEPLDYKHIIQRLS
jgi:hypothetical protein